MKKIMLVAAASVVLSGVVWAQEGDYPPDADAGACFARVLVPEVTEVATEQVIDQPEGTQIRVIPAVYETVTERILVQEEAVEYVVTPAVFETVTEQVMVTPERTETVVFPAEYETYSEQVLVRPAYVTWKPGAGLFGRDAGGAVQVASSGSAAVATGEVLCRVEVPAQYETVSRTRVKTPERSETTVIPATFETVEKRVVVTPASVQELVVPAQFADMTVERLVEPTREEIVVIPATYKTVEKRVVTGGGGVEWREVLCDTNATPEKIAEVQQALTAAGYTVPADGVFGPSTLVAMEAYQRANGLPVGYLTVSTVEMLGVSPR